MKTTHTAGRVQLDSDGSSLDYSWPGVYFDTNFTGTGIGIQLADSVNNFDIFIDGNLTTQISQPGNTTYWVSGLANVSHTIRLAKRTESDWSYGRLLGLLPAAGGQILTPPANHARQIEFIGDSYTAGYGNQSPSRTCTNDEIIKYTDANISFGALAANFYNADYQLNAYSGLGMVRNYNGNLAGTSLRTYYDRALVSEAGNIWQNPGTWKPQVVVIGLGINDFSTPLNFGEPYTQQSLIDSYVTAYKNFIAKLRASYGSQTSIVVSATYLSNTSDFSTAAQRVVNEMKAAGDTRVFYFYYDGLSGTGCQWHPSVGDHQLIAQKLETFIDALPNAWLGASR